MTCDVLLMQSMLASKSIEIFVFILLNDDRKKLEILNLKIEQSKPEVNDQS